MGGGVVSPNNEKLKGEGVSETLLKSSLMIVLSSMLTIFRVAVQLKSPSDVIKKPIIANRKITPATRIPSIIVDTIQPRPALLVLLDLVPRRRVEGLTG